MPTDSMPRPATWSITSRSAGGSNCTSTGRPAASRIARSEPAAVAVDPPAVILRPHDVRRGLRVAGARRDSRGNPVDPQHSGIGRPGTALSLLHRHFGAQAVALQLGNQVREPGSDT